MYAARWAGWTAQTASCNDAAVGLGFTEDAATTLRRAALVHDFGITAIPNTADHHIQNTYTKIGVSTRGAAALWAMQNGLLG